MTFVNVSQLAGAEREPQRSGERRLGGRPNTEPVVGQMDVVE
jgi:hypothetical protein